MNTDWYMYSVHTVLYEYRYSSICIHWSDGELFILYLELGPSVVV